MIKINYYKTAILTFLIGFSACSDWLEPETYTSISPSNFYQTRSDVEAAVVYAYSTINDVWEDMIYNGEYGTDEYWTNDGGKIEYNEFFWSTNGGGFTNLYWDGIRNVTRVGVVIENINEVEFLEAEDKLKFLGELKAIRAIHMFNLLNNYGACPVLLKKDDLLLPDENLRPERPKPGTPEYVQYESDYIMQIERDLDDAIEALPDKAIVFGKMDKGIALTCMMKLNMLQKDWDEVVDYSQQIMDLGQYMLEPEYSDIWNIKNERHDEIIWAIQRTNVSGFGQTFRTNTLKTEYDITDEQKWNGDKIQFDFYDTFDTMDLRRNKIVVEFVNMAGDTINMRTDGDFFGGFNLKYDRDPDAPVYNGTDVIMLRYADVLLSRAEALNELDGVNQESIDLINSIRERTGLEDISNDDFTSKEELRDHILDERGWEFYMEGLRREDMIRHGKYILSAQNRSIDAKDHQTLYPIPNDAIQENPNITQNPGY